MYKALFVVGACFALVAQAELKELRPSDADHLGTVPVSETWNAGFKGPRAELSSPDGAVKAADFGFAESGTDNAAAINRALARCRETKAGRLVLAPGRYRCFGGTSVRLEKLANFTLDGAGAELVFRELDERVAVRIADCTGIAVRGLGIVCEKPMSEGVRVDDSSVVRIEGCRFANPPYLVGRFNSGDIAFRDNGVVCGPSDFGVGMWRGAIAIADVPDVVVEGNRYRVRRGSAMPVVECFRKQGARTAVRANRVDLYDAVSGNDLWEIFGSFGKVSDATEAQPGKYAGGRNGCRVETTMETEDGVCLRKTVLKNMSDKTVTAHCLMDRFALEEGDWEVYTQVSYWENESQGRWQPLNTAVEVRNPNMRACNGASPMLAVWNRQTGRGQVFHLLTDSAYEMHVVRNNTPGGNRTAVAVEVGMDARQLAYPLKPGEEVALPQVLSYAFTNKLDLDCHRLHAWWNRHHPGRPPAAIYNTWLCRFDKLDADFLLKQVARAKDLGMEYFVIDAGWFGPKADWGSVRGEWVERPDGYLNGRMREISAAARAAGMKFGFWVEAESVAGSARVRKEHPEWMLRDNASFLDFENPAAFAYIVDTVCALVKKYDASFLKFDFNQNLDHDSTGRAFTAYNAAYRAFVREVRRRNPGIYIEGCASGGYMMDLSWARDFDGFWLSDNQSPRHGVRIVKETMLRLPPRYVERWIVARTATGLQPDYGGRDMRLFATEDATWTQGLTYPPSYIDAFAASGPYCFSCDLTAFSDEHLKHFAGSVAHHKTDAKFWQSAVGRILCDTPHLVAFQYSDPAFEDVRIVVVPEVVSQRSLRVRPVLDPSATYLVGDRRLAAAEIARDGIAVPVSSWNPGFLTLKKVK